MDFIVIGIVAVLVILALTYMIKEKKKGVKCIGCPAGGHCCSCSSDKAKGKTPDKKS